MGKKKLPKQSLSIDPGFEEELLVILNDLWDNRGNLNHSNLRALRHFAKKEYITK